MEGNTLRDSVRSGTMREQLSIEAEVVEKHSS